MSDFSKQLSAFAKTVSDSDGLWALAHEGGWVICDSAQFEMTDVMPIWSTEEGARAYCIEAWADYQPTQLSLDEFLEQWVGELHDDGVLVGLDWPQEQTEALVEVDPIALLKAIVGDTSA